MKKHLFPILLLISITLIVYWRWFFSLGILTYGDFWIDFPERAKEFFSFPLLWHAAQLFGFNDVGITFWPFLWMLGFLTTIHVPPQFIERIIFFGPATLISVISSYCLSYYIFKNRASAIISSIVYSFNTSFITTLTGILTVGTAVSFFPLIMLFFMLLLGKRRLIYVLLTGIVAFIIGFYDFRMLYMIFWVLLFYFIYYFIFLSDVQKQRKEIRYIVLLLGILIAEIALLNAYWLLGLFNTSAIISNDFFDRPLIGQDFVDMAKSVALFLYLWTNTKYYAFIVQPILFYFWFVPLFAFLGLLYHKWNKKVAFFALIAFLGIFLSKQSNPPFPTAYLWLYHHLPGFNAFRESTKFYYYTMFGYSILIGAFISFLSFWAKKPVQKKIRNGIVFFIALIFLINTKPLITGEIGTLFTTRTIPKDYYDLKTFLSNDQTFFRTLSVPNMQRFTYYTNHHPAGGFFAMPDKLRLLTSKLLNLESIKYIILPFDSMDDIYQSYGPQSAFMEYVKNSLFSESDNNKKLIGKTFGNIHIWKNPNAYPHFFTLQDLIYVKGVSNIPSLIDLPTSDAVGYYNEQFPTETTPLKIANYITGVNNTMSQAATKTYYVSDCIRCDTSKSVYDYITVPFAKYYPDSPFYGLVKAKEQTELKKTHTSIIDDFQINSKLFLKRVVEIQGLLSTHGLASVVTDTIDREDALLMHIDKLVNTVGNPIMYNDALLNTSDYLAVGRRILSDEIQAGQSDAINPLLTAEKFKIDTVLKDLNSKVWKTDVHTKRLIVNLLNDDTYNLYVKNDPDNDPGKSELTIGTQSAKLTSDKYGKVGSYFLPKGIYPIELKVSPINLLEGNTTLKIVAQNALQSTVIPIKSLGDPKSIYKLTFDYTIISGDSPRVYIEDHASTVDVYSKQIYYPVSTRLNDAADGKVHTATFFFHAHYGTTNPELHIDLAPRDLQGSECDLTNLTLIKVIQPTVVFIKQNKPQYDLPNLSFEEISPTFYRVHITNAKNPYALSFAEGFDMGWNAYINQNETLSSQPIKTYPENNVTELKPSFEGIFTMMSILIGKKTKIPETSHGAINGFGNIWLINKPGSYSLDIVFIPELYSIMGFIISTFTLIIMLGIIVYLLFRKRW